MLANIITIEEFEKFKAPLLEQMEQLRQEVVVSRILLKDRQWLDRVTAEAVLGVSAPTLKNNAEKWGISYRKGKLFIEYWLPDILKYLKNQKHLLPGAIEDRIRKALDGDIQQEAA